METNQAGDRARDGWDWVRSNPWPVLGALVAVGALLAWQRRGDPARRLAHMDADHAVGHARSFRLGGGTDEVAERMSQASS